MAGTQKGIDLVVITIHMLISTVDKLYHHFRYGDVVDMKEDIIDPLFNHLIEQHSRHRCRCLKTYRKEDHLFVRMLLGDL